MIGGLLMLRLVGWVICWAPPPGERSARPMEDIEAELRGAT